MKKTALSVIFSLFGLLFYAQNEASNWYFGENAGISFDLASNTIIQKTDGQLNTREGCSSISDEDGNLLFYTDGVTIWNSNHLQMVNGFGLHGDSSSTQSAIIVPKPADSSIYYVFTVDNSLDGVNNGLNYSIVDMTLNGGLGQVTAKNTQLLSFCSEKITAVLKDCVTESIWVVTYASEDGTGTTFDTFHAFEISNTGINTTSVKSPGMNPTNEIRGYLKLSPDGTKAASANIKSGLFLYDFDSTLGTLSNETALFITSNNGGAFPYGVEFSPNSQLLYVHSYNDYFDTQNPNSNNNPANHKSTLSQFNLADADVQNSQVNIDSRQLYRGALQLGPDGKIYRALSSTYDVGLPFLGVIENPNVVGPGCTYRHNAINLSPFNSSQGLPPFIASFFNTEIDIIKNGKSSINLDICDGGSYILAADDIPGATYIWTVDGAPLPETDFDLEIFQEGHYQVYIEPNNGDCALEGQAFVNFVPNPEANNHVLLQCDEDGIADNLTTFNLTEAHNELVGNIFNRSTKFYQDFSRTIELNADAYNNISNPQTVYVEVINDLTECSSFSELVLAVSSTSASDASLEHCDDDGIEDGFYSFTLSDAENDIIKGLPAGLNLSYFETYNDALLEINHLPITYTNIDPYNQVIYARVENANNCYGISEVLLTVHELPNIETEGSDIYCINFFPSTINIDAGLINDASSNYNYNWSNGDTNYVTQINEVGTYTVTVTHKITGCTKNRTVTVEPSNIATFQDPAFEVTDASQSNTITVFVSGEGTYQYSLIDENNITTHPYQDSNYFENVFPGIYNVLVKDVKNDCGIVNQNVSVIGFPKFFTPNNDGVNDTWKIYGVSSMFQPNTKIQIFNRYGKLVKEFDPLGQGWNGLYQGEILPSDDYWFAVRLQDGRIFKDHFTLKH
ncbi:T9SS type B sorting domain-containing protein [Algibacter luteus]|uniref:Gliding motility-associated C-terminal domain-containing protein n=1 Tax=Algibacter luteus TaxID=1178825 RepID=A0A1M6FTD7_9FLAO|nr:T9SS type B sorting domain-containing protein [Algibacter luteus]SHJ00930.1 gliding motility-associated C-terminal domain-containing protein [Algibacter luteus]